MRKALVPILLLVLLAACHHEPPNLHSPGSTIVVLGDSISVGVGVAAGEAYPELIAARLKTEIINDGVSGDTTADGLARLDQVLAQNPWLVIVELGGNDILRQVPPDQAEKNLRTILDRILAAHVLPVLIEVDAPFAGHYNAMYDRLADDYHIPIVDDVLGEILRSPSLKSDQIHPNAQGQRELADAVAKEIEPLIKARERRR